MNPTFTWLEGKRGKKDPEDPWPSDLAILPLATSYGSGVNLDCQRFNTGYLPNSVTVHSAATQRALMAGSSTQAYFPYAGQRGTKTYGHFNLISGVDDVDAQGMDAGSLVAVKEGVSAGMLVTGQGTAIIDGQSRPQYITDGDSGGPVYAQDDPSLLLGITEGAYQPTPGIGIVGWISPLAGACEWVSDAISMPDLLATYYDDRDGNGATDIKLTAQLAAGGEDVVLSAWSSLSGWPNGTYTLRGAGSLAPRLVTVGRYLGSQYYALLANSANIQLYSASTGAKVSDLAAVPTEAPIVGLYTVKINSDSYDDLVVLDANGAKFIYTGGPSGLTLNTAARFTAIRYDSDSLIDFAAVVNGNVYVSQSTLGYLPANYLSTYGENVASGLFRSDSGGKGEFLLHLSSAVSTGRVMRCTAGASNCVYLAGTKNVSSIEVRDVNRDGYDDVFLTYSDETASKWLLGGGTSASPFIDALAGDDNGDGYADYLAFAPDGTEIYLVGTVDGPVPAEWVDLDGDGDLDIRYVDSSGAPVLWYQGPNG
ncbi:MAG TPA: hypothetical protein VIN62_01880, partial [Candidatus Cryosericum sp.]